jgi:HEAT repeat protein
MLTLFVATLLPAANPIPKAPDARPMAPAPLPPFLAPKPPSPQAIKQVETRRKELAQLTSTKLDSEMAAYYLERLNIALKSTDDHVMFEAARDVTNGEYRAMPDGDLLNMLIKHVGKLPAPGPLDQRGLAQHYLLEHVARRYGPQAKEILPDLLKAVRDDKLDAFRRSEAIEAAARIGPGDRTVVEAFIDALNNPNPKDTSGVHDRIVEHLGDMGKAAWPAKKAIAGIITSRSDFYHDGAFIALGKLAMDGQPRPLAEHLERLQKVDELPMDEIAAAFLHVQKLCNPGAPIRDPNSIASTKPDPERQKLTEQARPALLHFIDKRFKNDVYTCAALRTLSAIGSGSSPDAAKVLLRVMTFEPKKYHRFQHEAGYALTTFEAKDKAAVPILADGLEKLLESNHWPQREIVLKVLRRYGKNARSAVPSVLKTMKKMETTSFAPDELFACADVLAGMGADAEEGRSALIALLDKDHPTMMRIGDPPGAKIAGEVRKDIQADLLIPISRMGLPTGKERTVLLKTVVDGLKSDRWRAFSASALIVERNGRNFTDKEADESAPLLERALDDKHKLIPDARGAFWQFATDGPTPGGRISAIQALGALGPKAKKALPALEKLAAQPIVDVRGTFLPEPASNPETRAAQKAVKLIRE